MCCFLRESISSVKFLCAGVHEEIMGADYTEHGVKNQTFEMKLEQAVETLGLSDENVHKVVQQVNSTKQYGISLLHKVDCRL